MPQCQSLAAGVTRVVRNPSSKAYLYDPAIVKQGPTIGKTHMRQSSTDSTARQQTDAEEDSLIEQSKALFQLAKSTCPNAAATYIESGNATDAQDSASPIINPTNYVEALDLARCGSIARTLTKPDYLDLALRKVQQENLPEILKAIQRGRLATVKETVAEAYATFNADSSKVASDDLQYVPNGTEIGQVSSSTADVATSLVTAQQAKVVDKGKKLSKSQKKRLRRAKKREAFKLATVQEAAAVNTVSSTANEKSAQGTLADLDSIFGELPERWEDSEVNEPLPTVDDHNHGIVNKGNVHSHLYFAVQHLRPPGFVRIRILQDADRSLEWFKNSFNGQNAGLTRIQGLRKVDEIDDQEDVTPVLQDQSSNASEPEFHHLNALWSKVYNKSGTPPEVSLWATITCKHILEMHGVPRECSMKAVLITQAWKYVDPWTYSGPEHLLRLNFATLRDIVIGLTEKVYTPEGTWGYDEYDEDENIPRCCEDSAVQFWQTYIMGQAEFYHCLPHKSSYTPDDAHWVVVKKDMSKTVSGGSKLRYVQEAQDKDDSSSATILSADPQFGASPELTLCQFTSNANDQQLVEVDQVEDDLYKAEVDPDQELLAHDDQALDVDEAESDAESLCDSSLEGSPRKALLRKEEWRFDYVESPERVRNRLSGAEHIPGFRSPMEDIDYPESEAPTEDEVEHDLLLPATHSDDGSSVSHADVDTLEPVTFLDNEGELDAAGIVDNEDEIPEADVPLHAGDSGFTMVFVNPVLNARTVLTKLQLPDIETTENAQTSNEDSGLHSSDADTSLTPGNGTPATPLSPILPFNSEEALDMSSKAFDAANEHTYIMSDVSPFEIDYEGIADMMDIQAPLIADHGSADVAAIDQENDRAAKSFLLRMREAPASTQVVDASDIVFEANNEVNDESRVEQPPSAEQVPNSDSAEPEREGLRVLENYFDAISRAPVAEIQDSTSRENSLQMVLYNAEPRWSKVLKFWSRLLKRAAESLHKQKANNEVPEQETYGADDPVDTEQMPGGGYCRDFSCGKSALAVGKQGIKVGKAAIGVGMLPVHAGVLAAKTPFKAARTTWKVGMWAWDRVGGTKVN